MVKPTIEEYKETLNKYQEQLKEHFYNGGVIICPYVENNNITDYLLLIPERNI